ncbi:hypothetical protein, partial [Paractinoplanes ferrugineus]|uniref:hypothetical protein n=1 Tax=Paractinoplanes ferrugineus TaxID=113564 RepID=UPI001EF237FD
YTPAFVVSGGGSAACRAARQLNADESIGPGDGRPSPRSTESCFEQADGGWGDADESRQFGFAEAGVHAYLHGVAVGEEAPGLDHFDRVGWSHASDHSLQSRNSQAVT